MTRVAFVISILLLAFTSFAQQPAATQKGKLTKLSGRVTNQIAPEVSLTFFKDMVSLNEETYALPIQGDDNFSMSFELNESTQITFNYMGINIKLFIEPGDDLFIQFDAVNFRNSVRFSGVGSLQNNYLLQTYKMYNQWDEQTILYEMSDRSPMDFKRFMDRIRSQQLGFYRGYPERDKFSQAFSYYAHADIDYWWAYYLLRYRVENFTNQRSEERTIPKEYYSFLDEVLINNDQALSNPYYIYFLDKYLNFRKVATDEIDQEPASIRVDVPSIFVLTQPEKPPIVTEVKQGDRMRYLHEKSTFKTKVLIKDALHEDYWYKVKTGDGYIGWAIGVGLTFENESTPANDPVSLVDNRESEIVDRMESDSLETFEAAKKYLKGNALYYVMANDLYWNSRTLPIKELEEQVDEFLLINPVNTYDQIAKSTLDQIKKEANPNIAYGAIVYRIVQAPVIENDAAGEPVVSSVVIDTPKEIAIEKQVTQSRKKDAPQTLVAIEEPTSTASKDTANVMLDTVVEIPVPVIPKKQTEFINIPLPKASRPTTPISLTGKIESFNGHTLKLVLYADPVTFIEEEYEIKLNGDRTFETNIELVEPSIGYLAYGDQRAPVFLEPGNQLKLNFHGNHFQKTLHFSGKGNVQNNYLIAQRKFFQGEAKVIQKKMKDAKQDEFVQYMREQREARLNFLQKFIDNYEMSFSFTNYAIADIDYWYGYNLLNYPWEHPLYHDQDAPMKMKEGYYDFLKNITVSQENALPNQNYTYFLNGYFDYQAELPENEGMTEMDMAERDLQGDVLNYYKCKLYSIACKRGKAKMIGPEIKTFIEGCDNETYNDVLRLAYNEAKGLTNGAPAPFFNLTDIDGNTVSLDDFKGKIVYLDFWASWCSPCIIQMRNSRSWKSNFKDKDVVFLYVSLDKKQSDWQRHVKNNRLEGIHLIADSGNVYQSKIARLYHVKRLPAVFLLDKQGNVYYNSTKDNSRLRLSEMINGLLLSN